MTGHPRKAPTSEAPSDSSLKQVFPKSQSGIFARWQNLWRKLGIRLSSRRRYPRQPIELSDPLLTQIIWNHQGIDVAPFDISEGGVGLEVSREFLGHFASGQSILLRLSLDGKSWQEVPGEVRYARPHNIARGYIGVEFKNPPQNLRLGIRRYRKQRPKLLGR